MTRRRGRIGCARVERARAGWALGGDGDPCWSVSAADAAGAGAAWKESAARLGERFGRESTQRPAGRLVWLHAASVGETLSALPLAEVLARQAHVLFTTGTLTSADMLRRRVAAAGLGPVVTHRFVPLDVPAWAGRFVAHWRPDAAVFIESELWPNLLAACRARGVPAVLVNARCSVRSAAGWGRVPDFARHVLGHFDWIAAQSAGDAARLRGLGAARVTVPGNLKFAAPALPADAQEVARLAALLGDAPRWLAASTHAQDDGWIERVHLVLAARHPGLITAVVPRHPARGVAMAQAWGAGRRSQGDRPAGLWIADTLGELGLLYRCFSTVVMGKSFAAGGGQNPWEPAVLGCAVACGPHMENFADAVARLTAAGVLAQVADEAGLIAWLDHRLGCSGARTGFAGVESLLPESLASDVFGLIGRRKNVLF